MHKNGQAACLQILREGDTPRPAGMAAPRNQSKSRSRSAGCAAAANKKEQAAKEQAACAAEMVPASPVECPQGFPGQIWSAQLVS